jgi:iron complex transport system substrate-binding protein
MKHAVILLGAALLLAGAAQVGALEVIDDRGERLILAQPARRIVTLAPHLAEIAYAIGAGAQVVGVSSFTTYPPEAARLPVIANAGRVNFERLVELKPDLVLAWRTGNSTLQLERLQRMGFSVLTTETARLQDVPRVMRLIGAATGREAGAERQAREYEQDIERLRQDHAGKPLLSVFVEIWHHPMLSVNGQHLISDALTLCGGRNVFAGAKPLTPAVSHEQLLGAQPDVIITSTEDRADWQGWEAVPAVRNKRIYVVNPDFLHRFGPRSLDGARAVCQSLDRARS